MKLTEQEWELVAVSRLRIHPQNPRTGDLPALRASLDAHGFFGALVVQKSTGFILAGNHRYRAACQRGAERLPVLWIDCDDAAALRILLADNRTSDLAHYDDAALAELLRDLQETELGLTGVGYTDADLGVLEAALSAALGEQPPADDQSQELLAGFRIVIDCDSDLQQRELLQRFAAEGLRCRALLS